MTVLHAPRPELGSAPLICVSLMPSSLTQLVPAAQAALAQGAQILEWRIDFLSPLQTSLVLDGLSQLRAAIGSCPLIVTCRDANEGGQKITLDRSQVLTVLSAACLHGGFEYLDFEQQQAPNDIEILRQLTLKKEIGLILSRHYFERAPQYSQMLQFFLDAYTLKADVAKLAVMPQNAQDVAKLLAALKQTYQHLPLGLVAMAMGEIGAFSRLIGGHYGSSLTFARLAAEGSAPGQWPIDTVQLHYQSLYR